MGLISDDPIHWNALLFCETCGAVLLPEDRPTPQTFNGERRAPSSNGRWSCHRCPSCRQAAGRTAGTNRLHGLRVLIAEDDSESCEALSEALTLFGATCTMTSSGNEAFGVFTQQPPDILIADLWMPDGDGFDLIGRIRALTPERGGLVPAIAVSGMSNGEQAMMAGYQVMVAKPLDLATVVSIIEEFVRTEADTPARANSWTLSSPSPEMIVMTFKGYVSAGDVRALMAKLLCCLEERTCNVVVDLRELTGFSVAGASVAQRAVWAKRHAIGHVQFVGGPLIARLAASAACRLLGLSCTVESGA